MRLTPKTYPLGDASAFGFLPFSLTQAALATGSSLVFNALMASIILTNTSRASPYTMLQFSVTSVFLPANNPIAQAPWIDLQRVAHALERERSVAPCRRKSRTELP